MVPTTFVFTNRFTRRVVEMSFFSSTSGPCTTMEVGILEEPPRVPSV
jgi:hypothetical protein